VKIFSNAEALFTEATILANEGAWARALFLHQISLEECAKIEIIGASVVSALRGQEIQLNSLQRTFSRHESKNNTNAYFLPLSESEKHAIEKNDIHEGAAAFKYLQKEFHKDSNGDKNTSLYVDYKDDFISPLETISENTFIKVRERNEIFMSLSDNKIKLLNRWSENLDKAAEEVAQMFELFELDETERGSIEQFDAIKVALEEKTKEVSQKKT
jgi:AbiV family abortive infection protein